MGTSEVRKLKTKLALIRTATVLSCLCLPITASSNPNMEARINKMNQDFQNQLSAEEKAELIREYQSWTPDIGFETTTGSYDSLGISNDINKLQEKSRSAKAIKTQKLNSSKSSNDIYSFTDLDKLKGKAPKGPNEYKDPTSLERIIDRNDPHGFTSG